MRKPCTNSDTSLDHAISLGNHGVAEIKRKGTGVLTKASSYSNDDDSSHRDFNNPQATNPKHDLIITGGEILPIFSKNEAFETIIERDPNLELTNSKVDSDLYSSEVQKKQNNEEQIDFVFEEL